MKTTLARARTPAQRTFAPIAFALLATFASTAMSQDRLPPIPKESYTEAQKNAADEFSAGRGYEVRGPFVPLMRSPEVMLRAKAMGDYLRYKSVLAPRLNEMVILITAREWTQQYEWVAHHDIAMKAGLKPEIAAAIAESRRPAGMAEDEEIVYDFCTELHRTKRVSDATWQRAVAKFGEHGVIDMIGVNGYYTFLAMALNAARTPIPATVKEPLKRFPE
jgi:4-carboxymuconolactone decarboxylase